MKRAARIGCAISGIALVLALAAGVVWSITSLRRAQRCAALLEAGDALLNTRDFDSAVSRYSAALAEAASNEQQAGAHFGRGLAENEKFQFDAAIRDLTEAISRLPALPQAYGARGYAYQRKGELDAALRDYADSLRLDPNNAQVYYNRGCIFMLRSQWDKAAADFDEAVRCDPRDALAHNERGKALLQKEDLGPALSSADAAIRLDPTLRDAFLSRAAIHRRRGEDEPARRDEAAAAALTPKPWPARQYAGANQGAPDAAVTQLLFKAAAADRAQRFDEAITGYTEALGRKLPRENAAVAFMNRGNAYYAKSDWDRALRDYDEAIRTDPKNAGAYVDRANVYSRKGERDKAMANLNEALALNPEQAEAYHNRGLEYRERGEFARALSDFDAAIRLRPEFVEAQVNRAATLAKTRRQKEALNDLTAAIRMTPKAPELYSARAAIRVQRSDFTSALADYEAALELQPKDRPAILNATAWIYATCPDANPAYGQRAVALASEACALSQWRNSDFVDTLATAHAAAGDFEAAVKFEQQALGGRSIAPLVQERMRKRLALYRKHKSYRDKPVSE